MPPIDLHSAARAASGEEKSRLGLIRQHLDAMLQNERIQWDQARAWMQGRVYTGNAGESEWSKMRTSANLTFAIVETAVASIVPRHPQVTCAPRVPMPADDVLARERYANMALDASSFRREQQMSVQDCVLCGRSIYKTTWSKKHNRPVVKALDPRSIIFDLTARRVEDIKYWCEVVVITQEQFKARLAAGKVDPKTGYVIPDGQLPPVGNTYPQWLMEQDVAVADSISPVQVAGTSGASWKQLQNWQPWITLYEWYDVDTERFQVWMDGVSKPIYDQPNTYVPYTMYALNSNAQDCRGLSEILLVKPNIEAVNKLLSYWLMLARFLVPKVMYDKSVIPEDKAVAAQSAPPGSWTGIDGSPNAARLSDAFAKVPMTEVPAELMAILAKEESIVSYVSALAEAARGQVTGARTATELALIEGQLRTRLRSRQNAVDDATADVVRKMLYLAARKLEQPITLRIGTSPDGQPEWGTIDKTQLDDISVLITTVPYDPIDDNRAVKREAFLALLPLVSGRPGADQNVINAEMVRVLDLPPDIFQKIQAPAPEQPGGIPGMSPPPGGEDASPTQLAEAAAVARNNVAQDAEGEPSDLPPQAHGMIAAPGGPGAAA